MRVTVLLGGTSEEREVSLVSGVEVCAALREAGHEVIAFDPAAGPLGRVAEQEVRNRGVSQVPAEPPSAASPFELLRSPEVTECDVAFVALHGGMGEDGTVQGMLDLLGVCYVGSGRLGCALAMDKEVSKRLLRDTGIRTPRWIAGLPAAELVERELGLPVIVKASTGGSSLRLYLAHDRVELERALDAARDFDDLPLCEEYVKGRELTVSIVGDRALPVGEIIPDHELFDYACKYQPGMAREIFPAEIPDELAREVQRIALEVHRRLRLRDFSRIDFIVDEAGHAWCLEANALPGMTPNSLLPRAARAAGLGFAQLCDELVQRAQQRG